MIPLLLLPATLAIGVALAFPTADQPKAVRERQGGDGATAPIKKAKAAPSKRTRKAVRKIGTKPSAVVRQVKAPQPLAAPAAAASGRVQPPSAPAGDTKPFDDAVRGVLHGAPPQPAAPVAPDGAAPPAPARPGFGSMAQFQLPSLTGPHGGPFRPVTEYLAYQYSVGSESDVTYRRDPDLDKRRRDNSSIMAPQINGYILYRPNDRIETLAEMILERELPVHEEAQVTLPNGDVRPAPRHRNMLAVDQAWIKFKGVGPVDVTVGRRNFEDERHWLYDTSLDTVHGRAKWQDFVFEAALVRKDRFDGDLFGSVEKGRNDRAMFYGEYRGIEDIKLGGYAIKSRDRAGQEGQPWHLGLRAYGTPSDRFAFWSDLALLRGKDELQRDFSAYAADVGLRYRYPALPLKPSITLGYAYGSGDDDPNDRRNRAFRQTGLQSNEVKGAGVSKFKYYGEALDPELSNLQILTVGLGLRPGYQVHVDLVYHKYRLNALADELRNAAVTAQMNQDAGNPSKDVGSALDLVVGLRNLFGERRLGIDLRVGLFRPGAAFRNEVGGDPLNPVFAGADKSISALVKFWW